MSLVKLIKINGEVFEVLPVDCAGRMFFMGGGGGFGARVTTFTLRLVFKRPVLVVFVHQSTGGLPGD